MDWSLYCLYFLHNQSTYLSLSLFLPSFLPSFLPLFTTTQGSTCFMCSCRAPKTVLDGECAGEVCNGHGKCSGSGGTCECFLGYGGELCETSGVLWLGISTAVWVFFFLIIAAGGGCLGYRCYYNPPSFTQGGSSGSQYESIDWDMPAEEVSCPS